MTKTKENKTKKRKGGENTKKLFLSNLFTKNNF